LFLGGDLSATDHSTKESFRYFTKMRPAFFIASDFIAEGELPSLLAGAEKDGVKIRSLILSPSRYEKIRPMWHEVSFCHLNMYFPLIVVKGHPACLHVRSDFHTCNSPS
jgi:hypothetical protein